MLICNLKPKRAIREIAKGQSISVCICTYKRPELLERLLSRLEEQDTEDLYDYSIVVVDNDRSESARQIVESFAHQSKLSICYHVEPEQNIALARNKAVDIARGEFIAFIDDDELPGTKWLLNLYQAIETFGSDGVLGPVLPCFAEKPPGWVVKGHFFDRPTHSTGHVLESGNTRTGNTLLRRELFEDGKWFDPLFGSGGEDREFFARKIAEGRRFLWCNEAPVFEIVTSKRWKRTVLVKRALLRGKMALNAARSRPASVMKSTAAIVIYAICLPLLLILGQHMFMKYLVKGCDHLGKLLAFCGIDAVNEKYVGGYGDS